MNIVPVSYNGTLINDGTNYSAFFPQGQSIVLQANSDAVMVERAFLTPIYAVKKLDSKTVPLTVVMRGTIATQLDSLKKLFNTQDQTPHELIIADASDSNRQWSVYATCIAHKDIVGAVTTFSMLIPDPVWYTVVENSSTWSITATGQTKTITTIGTSNAQPIFEITPTTTPTVGSTYQKYFMIKNISSSPLVNFPLSIMGSAYNTAALVTAGKMQSTGNDLRVYMAGAEVPRWLGAMNTTATRVWVNVNAPAYAGDGTLLDNIGTGVLTANFDVVSSTTTSTNNITFLQGLLTNAPSSGFLIKIDSEYMMGKNPDPLKGTLDIYARGVNSSTAATHLAGATVEFYAINGYITYGYATLGAPSYAASTQPIFNNATSTNTSWVYPNFGSTIGRPGYWTPSVIFSTRNSTSIRADYTYTGASGVSTDPATTTGMISNASTTPAETAIMSWSLAHPLGITGVPTSSGYKYALKLTNWNSTTLASMQYSTDGANFTDAYTVTAPTSANVNTAWSQSGATFSASKLIRMYYSGTIPASGGALRYETSAITLTIDSTYQPTMNYSAEVVTSPVNIKLTNTTTGEWMRIAGVWVTNNTTVTIDCKNKTATYNGVSYAAGLTWSSNRVQWLDLLPATNNVLKYEQDGAGNATVVVKWQDRKL